MHFKITFEPSVLTQTCRCGKWHVCVGFKTSHTEKASTTGVCPQVNHIAVLTQLVAWREGMGKKVSHVHPFEQVLFFGRFLQACARLLLFRKQAIRVNVFRSVAQLHVNIVRQVSRVSIVHLTTRTLLHNRKHRPLRPVVIIVSKFNAIGHSIQPWCEGDFGSSHGSRLRAMSAGHLPLRAANRGHEQQPEGDRGCNDFQQDNGSAVTRVPELPASRPP